MISSIMQALFFVIKFQPNMSEQEKKQQRIYNLLNAEIKLKFLCLLYIKQRNFFLQKKSFLRKRRSGGLKKKRKEDFLTALATAIKKAGKYADCISAEG